MNEWSEEADAIIAVVRAAISPALPAAGLGAERGWRSGDQLETGELPHLFVFNPRAADSPIAFGQVQVTNTYTAELWADVTHDQMVEWHHLIKAEVREDASLSGLVRRFRLTEAGIVENFSPDHAGRRVLVLTFTTYKVEG